MGKVIYDSFRNSTVRPRVSPVFLKKSKIILDIGVRSNVILISTYKGESLMGFTIKQTTEKTGIPADTLRYYDKEGIVSPKRHENGYRLYDDNDISSLKNIIIMKYAHFTLAEIKNMEEVFNLDPSANCNDICRGILNAKVIELKQAISNYQKIVALMEELLSMVDSADSYVANKEKVDRFISQIYDDIQNDSLFSPFDERLASDEKNEV